MSKNTPSKLLLKNQEGAIFITILLTGLLLTFIGLSLATTAISQMNFTHRNVYRTNAFLVAEAGIERSVYELNKSEAFTGLTEAVLFDNDKQGRGVYSTELTAGAGNEKILKSTGKVYDSNGKLMNQRSVKVSLVGTASPSPSVYAGPGGLNLGGSARINNSDVVVNGTLTMSGASSIGSDVDPVNLNVANIACPVGSNPGNTYPSLCSGTQPINMPDWGSISIVGSICATGQTQTKFPNSPYNSSPPQIRAGTSGGQGLISGCTATPAAMPIYDKSAHIARITTSALANDINYNCSTWKNPDGFKRAWPANLKLTGNVNATSSCDLTIHGDVYITGDLTIGGAASIKVADDLGSYMPTIIVEGTVDAGSGAKIIANSSGTALRIISYKSYNDCDPVCNGSDLKKSQDIVGVSVNGGGQYPGSVFQAYWSTIKVSGSGLVGSAIGQRVDMQGAGSITFGTNLSSGTTTWTIRSYQYDYE